MRGLIQLVIVRLLRAYKYAVSPMFPPSCRYVPTCSEYAEEAVERYGAVRGAWMTLLRLLRCHPLACGGYDPVVKTPPNAPDKIEGWTGGGEYSHSGSDCMRKA